MSLTDHKASNEHPIILFDGVCNLCNASVQFIIKRDQQAKFRFAALQSEFGQKILASQNLDTSELRTFILVDGDKVHLRSTAALEVARRMNWPWKLLYAFIIVPRPLRDAIYNFISRNRYRWFGAQESCMMPTPELRARFLDS